LIFRTARGLHFQHHALASEDWPNVDEETLDRLCSRRWVRLDDGGQGDDKVYVTADGERANETRRLPQEEDEPEGREVDLDCETVEERRQKAC
jgi:hypothetical protein